MAITLATIVLARKYRIGAVEQILSECYPRVHRMAHGLCGRSDVGRRVVKQVMKASLRQMPTWGTEGEPERWFDHHTILLWRRVSAYPPQGRDDVLVSGAADATPSYLAFVRSLRQLPVQQREAFLLHVGEDYDIRRIGIAMDCSREAAGNHLAAATAALEAMCGGKQEVRTYTQTIRGAWRAEDVRPQIVLPALRRSVRRHVWGRRVRRGIKLLLVLIIVALIAWVFWMTRQNP